MIKNVCVVGCGLMGKQIALNTAQYGYDVKLTDTVEKAREAAKAWADEWLAGRVAKGKMTQEKADEVKKHFVIVDTLEEAAKDADLVIEAIIEDKQIKMDFYKQLDGIISEDCLIGCNSSYMVSSTFKDCIKNPSRLANFHYFNPALVMKLVEVVTGEHTSMATKDALMDFARSTGKDPIWITKEIDGFVVNRILRVIADEAFWLVENGYCTAQEVDTAMEKGCNYPMGPFRLKDLTGNDLTYLALKRRYEETGVKPNGYDIMKKMYDEGLWGRKTGKGWYDYTKK